MRRVVPILGMLLIACTAWPEEPAQLEGSTFTVELAATGREVPFSLAAPKGAENSGRWIGTSSDGKLSIPLQVHLMSLYGILPASAPAGRHTFNVKSNPARDAYPVQVIPGETKPDPEVRVRGELLTRYHFAEPGKDRKPYLWPLLGEGGASITRDWPLSDQAGKTKDHPHHVSFWSSHGNINGADFWEYGERTGWQEQGSGQFGEGDVLGHIISQDRWVDKDHKPVVEVHTTYRFYNTPASARLIDVVVQFRAVLGEVKFGDTKEGGIVALRMNDDLREQGGTGKITMSTGAIGEKAAWGKPAAWCDYSGTLEGLGARGIAVMDSPQSFRHPVHWHVRGYGLMGANPFGYSAFYNGAKHGDHTLPKGESITFSYRLYIHSGDATAANVAGHYQDFANPPAAAWVK